METMEVETPSNSKTKGTWVKILIFFIALVPLASLCYYLLSPVYEKSRGVDFLPKPDQQKNPGSTLIWYSKNNDSETAFYYEQLTIFTNEIANPKEKDSLKNCDNENRATENKSCRVDTLLFGECNKHNRFGYLHGEPCILIKINPIFGWKPKPLGFNDEGKFDPELLQNDLEKQNLPDRLKEYIQQYAKNLNPTVLLNGVWISCDGVSPADKEYLGPLTYWPASYLPSYYFPYMKQPGYQTPYIYVQFKRPMAGVLINIKCQAWDRNTEEDNPLTPIYFEVMID